MNKNPASLLSSVSIWAFQSLNETLSGVDSPIFNAENTQSHKPSYKEMFRDELSEAEHILLCVNISVKSSVLLFLCMMLSREIPTARGTSHSNFGIDTNNNHVYLPYIQGNYTYLITAEIKPKCRMKKHNQCTLLADNKWALKGRVNPVMHQLLSGHAGIDHKFNNSHIQMINPFDDPFIFPLSSPWSRYFESNNSPPTIGLIDTHTHTCIHVPPRMKRIPFFINTYLL